MEEQKCPLCGEEMNHSNGRTVLHDLYTCENNDCPNFATYNIGQLDALKSRIARIKQEAKKEVLNEIKKTGYWKEGTTTYVVEERTFPHDERCEGTLCYCASRAKKHEVE